MRRVLSLWQPWATLCVVRDPLRNEIAKKIETRAFPPDRFHVTPPFETVVHATKGFNREQARICEDLDFLKALNARGYFAGKPGTKDQRVSGLKPLPLGQIIGVATVKECIPADDPLLLFAITEEEKKFGLYLAERWAWILAEQQEIPEPIPFKGRQQVLYPLDGGLNAEVTRQLGLTLATSGVSAQNSTR